MKNKNNKNGKRGGAAAKQAPEGGGAKYTPLSRRKIEAIVEDTADDIFDSDLGERVRKEAEIEEHEDNPGTWFVSFRAKTWRETAMFTAAVIGAAFARGHYAEASAIAAKDGGRLVDVFIAAADFITDDGKPVI